MGKSTTKPPLPQAQINEMSSSRLLDVEKNIPALARRAVETYVLERLIIDPPPSLPIFLMEEQSACFVSIKTINQKLRGCIGTIEPERSTLAEEIITNAINAAIQDPRFSPVSDVELSFLHYSVDVLSPPELTHFDDLDPSIYGVVVVDHVNKRCGLLLPNLKGIETASQQIQIAASKAGIALHEPYKIYRFQVDRFSE